MRSGGLDVQFYEVFAEEEAALRRWLPPTVRAGFTAQTVQESGHDEPPCGFVCVRTQSVLPPGWATRLRGVLARATGYDGLVRWRQEARRAVALGYLPLYCARAVAEQAMLMWLALLRKLPLQVRKFATFHRDGLTGRECEGKRLLVVGVGNIGGEVVRLGRALGMEVRGVDLVQRDRSLVYVAKEEGIAWADVVVCAMNLTRDNVGYFSHEVLRRARRGLIFVNVARGEMSPAADLLRLVEEGHLGGVGLDVFEAESVLAVALRRGGTVTDPVVRATLALAKHPNVLCTPHNAFNTEESVERKARQTAEQVEHFLRRGQFLWPVP